MQMKEPTAQGQDPGLATVPPTILFVMGVTLGTPHDWAKMANFKHRHL